MFAVIFEVRPRPDWWERYLAIARMLRPELERIEGFLENTRYRSDTREGLLLSLSLWRDEKALIRWRTHAGHFAAQGEGPNVGVFVFAPDPDPEAYRVYSRMFAPHTSGIPEDPATGSASGPLGAYLVERGLVAPADTLSIVSEQGTRMGRPSFIRIQIGMRAGRVSEILVGGSVVPVIEGLLWALAPQLAMGMLARAASTPEQTLRRAGWVAVCAGLVLVWLVRG